MSDRQTARPADSLLRIASLRDFDGSRDRLIRRFLIDLSREPGGEGASLLLDEENGEILYHLAGTKLVRQEVGEGEGTGSPSGHELTIETLAGKPIGFLILDSPVDENHHILSLSGFLGVTLDNLALLDEARIESRIDPITGIHNYRHVTEELQRELDRARRFDRVFSILMADLDRFKEINDRLGHLKGNSALRKIAQLFLHSIRSVDTAAKYGGDEFLIILPDTGGEGAFQAAERLLSHLSELSLEEEMRISASIGVATYPTDGKQARELIGSADRALYRAKDRGGGAVAA